METMVLDRGHSTYLVNTAHLVRSEDGIPADLASTLDTDAAAAGFKIDKSNPYIQWIAGDFVEADKPNSNTQFWTAADLSLAEYSIKYAPLNMVHRFRNPIGFYAATKTVQLQRQLKSVPADATAEEMAAAAKESQGSMKIQALSGLWSHIFPFEAAQTEAADAEGLLFYCVDDETELMTATGWRRFADLAVDDEILTLNRGTGLSEWLPTEKVHRFDVQDTEMVRMEGQQHSSLTTPNHRWWVNRRGTGYSSWATQTSATLTNGAHIPRAMPHGDYPTEPKYSDDFVELAAWCWTDAGLQNGSLTICQSSTANSDKVARIDALFARLDIGERRGEYARGLITWGLHVGPSRAVLEVMPERLPTGAFLRSLTRSQLELFIQVSILADGTVHKDHGQTIFYAETEDQAKVMEMACALVGQVTNTTEVKVLERKKPAVIDGVTVRANKNIWRVCLVRRSNFIAPVRLARLNKGFAVTRERYTGTVWCPQTPNQTFLARRRGTVYWTQNSMECRGTHLVCAGDSGCGEKFDYMAAETHCEHLKERSSIRHIVTPTFRGGALIVPPVRPGWKNANATVVSDAVMMEAAAFAEQNESQYAALTAGGADLTASGWEHLMGMVLQAHGSPRG
jgi:hypothetical protein